MLGIEVVGLLLLWRRAVVIMCKISSSEVVRLSGLGREGSVVVVGAEGTWSDLWKAESLCWIGG